jgi:nucleoside-diphosphate-sugar epimerase
VKVLVTGAAGFLGSAVVERLLAHQYCDIRCHVRRPGNIPRLDALSRRFNNAKLEYCVGNLRYRDDAAQAVDDVQLIFHLAAGKTGAAAELFTDSVIASRNILEAIADRKPMRVVLVSSFGVYGTAELRRGAHVTEQTPLERHPERRDHYSHSKLRQEQLFWEYQNRNGFELVVLRPGVIYGPGGSHFSNRVGLTVGKWQLCFGGRNLLPLTYVENCAEAVVTAGTSKHAAGQAYNVHDDDLPTCREYLRTYKKYVVNVRSFSVPYFALRLLSRILGQYNAYSKGQLPAIFTPYKVASLWAGNHFDNSKLRSLGWRQLVSTPEGLRKSFAAFQAELKSKNAAGSSIELTTRRDRALCPFVPGPALEGQPGRQFESPT